MPDGALAGETAALPTRTLGAIKGSLHAGFDGDLATALEREGVGQSLCGHTADHGEGLPSSWRSASRTLPGAKTQPNSGRMATVNIRDASPADLPAIVEIYNQTVPGRMVTADLEPVSVEDRREWFFDHSPQRRPLWVAEVGGEIAGWLGFEDFRKRPAYHATAEISVYVAEKYRRGGIGRQLLSEAIRRAPSLGLRILTGGIFAHNTPSLRLFESFGFERWAHYPAVAELDGVERDLVVVGLRLDEQG